MPCYARRGEATWHDVASDIKSPASNWVRAQERTTTVRRFHHVGIPTAEQRPGERYLAEFGMDVAGYEDRPHGVEWMRFDPDSPIPLLVQRVPHVAFEVDDLEEELVGQEILIRASPSWRGPREIHRIA